MTELPSLLLLTPSDARPVGELLRTVAGFVDVGLRGVLVRERQRPQAERLELAGDIASVMNAAAGDEPTLVALASPGGPHATHWRADEAPLATPAAQPWGRSCHTAREFDAAARDGAAWVTYGPYAASVSKPGHGPGAGTISPTSNRASDSPPRRPPVFALGGVTADNAAAAQRWSGHGVAVLGSVWQADDPRHHLARLRAALHPTVHLDPHRTPHVDQGESS